MATTLSIETIIARARTLATQTGGDANSSVVIDSKPALRALIPHIILNVYRKKANDQRFLRDITVRSTVAMTSGVGTLPDTILREFLDLGDFQTNDTALITYYKYAADYNSGQNYPAIGYAFLIGDQLQYTAPSPVFNAFTGNLYITTPSTPVITTSVTFPTEAMANDVIYDLSLAITGKLGVEVDGTAG